MSKSLRKCTLNNWYDGTMWILDWLADNLTATMLKRWMLIWLTVVMIGVISLFT